MQGSNDTHALSRRTAATTREGRLPETDGAKCCQQSDQVGPYLASTCTHQMVPPKQGRRAHLMIALLLIYRPRKDKRLSWPGWLTCSGWFTHTVVTRQLQAKCRTESVRQPKTGIPPTVLSNQLLCQKSETPTFQQRCAQLATAYISII